MKLSVIIVNYNVKYILEQCLYSVKSAIRGIDAEVFVVDNNSVDGSCAMLREKFPWIILIENKENVGFSRANNQAIRKAKGKYVLLLNPDTLVEEDTFIKTLDFMDAHPDGGGLGVTMIDGKGKYLPESKRGLPTLKVSFFKMFGFHKIFPKSKRFNYYYLGHLDEKSVQEIEILSGAFMLLRASVLEKVGLLDEEYFMYGEDIDLSYRIIKAGYKNYFYPHTTIIHYKGESTKKASFKYVLVFYKAMEIFARKQLHMKKFSVYWLFIHSAIWVRAGMALISRGIKKVLFPTIDFAIILSGFFILAHWWAAFHFGDNYQYPQEFFTYIAPLFTGITLMSIYLSAGYERPVKIANLLKGIVSGFVFIIILYSLFHESMRYSRVLLFLGFAWNIVFLIAVRLIFHFARISNFKILVEKNKNIVLVGDETETERVFSFLQQTGVHANIIGFVSLDETVKSNRYIGTIHQLQEVVNVHGINEIIFCLKDVGAAQIIQNMLYFSDLQVEFKIAPPESFSVIGSSSVNTAGELYVIEFNSIAKGMNRRKKRLFDIATSLCMVITSLFWIWFIPNKKNAYKNFWSVLFGYKTFVGYSPKILHAEIGKLLPKIRPSILFPGIQWNWETHQSLIEQAHIAYAKDYKVRNDFMIIMKNIAKLGNQPNK